MSQKLYEENSIQDIANAIRLQNGTHDAYTVAQMGNAIRAIKTQPVLESLTVSQNGSYSPGANVDGFDEVHVAVPSATLTTKSITQNGTYNASSDNADGYSSVTVNVSGGGSAAVQPLSVTQNGTYSPPSGVDGYAPVTVNVSGGSEISLPAEYKQVEYLTTDASTYTYVGMPFYQLVGDRLQLKAKADWTQQQQMATGGLKTSFNQSNGYRANWHILSSYRSIWADGGAVDALTNDPTITAEKGTRVRYGEMLSPNDFAEIDITFDSTNNSIMYVYYGCYASGQWSPSTDLYDLFVFRADGNIAIHLVPCVRIADSVCGFYDLQTGTFLTANHGSFTAGPDAVIPDRKDDSENDWRSLKDIY